MHIQYTHQGTELSSMDEIQEDRPIISVSVNDQSSLSKHYYKVFPKII